MIVFLIFLIVSALLIVYSLDKSFFEPTKLYTLFWTLQIVLVSAIYMKAYNFSGLGFLYISFSILVFSLSSSLGKSFTFHLEERAPLDTINLKRANSILLIISVLSFAYPFIKIAHYGFGAEFLLNIVSLFEMNNEIAKARYNGEEINTMSDQILLIFVYLTPLYAGYISTFASKRKWLYYLVFIPTFIVAITQSMKLGFIASAAFWFSGKITAYFVAKKPLPQLKTKQLLKISLVILLFFGLLFFSMLLRTDEINSESIKIIEYRFINYSLGHMVAFDEWFTYNWNTYYPFELKTFYGISNAIGLGQRVQGVFEEFINYSNDIFPEEMISNVFTTFRFWIEDFGIFGSYLYTSLYGLFSGLIYGLIKKNFSSTLVITMYAAFFFMIILSFATSVWAYTSFIMVFFVFYFIMRITFSNKIKITDEQ